jgi:protocatechuate 3,4-dioxygenase beta subunit
MMRAGGERGGGPVTVPSRRSILKGILAVPVAGWAVSWGGAEALAATPACPDADEPTPDQGPGPFYKPRSPERRSFLEPGQDGTRLLVTGRVVTTRCRPVAGALVDFWHCDAAGEYDMAGHRFRGHQFADAAGGFSLETILPAAYMARTPHLHVRVQPPGGAVLTTAIYLSLRPHSRDGQFDPALVMEVGEQGDARKGAFTFVLPA